MTETFEWNKKSNKMFLKRIENKATDASSWNSFKNHKTMKQFLKRIAEYIKYIVIDHTMENYIIQSSSAFLFALNSNSFMLCEGNQPIVKMLSINVERKTRMLLFLFWK